MRAIWQLVDTCKIPTLTYALEGWIPTKTEGGTLQQTFNKALTDILELPDSTPTYILLMETGYLPVEKIIKKIRQKLCIEQKPEDTLVRSVTKEGIWKYHIDQIVEKYQIQNPELDQNTSTY